ncbi:malto-oligosyltrehalose synthase [Aureimonas phyllosphaerae]|uniref:(1->4)-alpha-D-glucan 1-alpha-D-glucosylmutase n=1 Tax=Aureimonas phyllosphaerae TaxID=1166078 RepID=A0A7W6BUL8_9HYPH|nr:malto-oligosyltrehalose synthase [Aureimonas phyllosphaerae]MBB3938301.1 (1->4)-alpha-D-glucan 1-alpha-D-glucosylmutase [Aureimonas phyllosphaerae]MBB3962308.1 (1->4)-alpha-D-glucan 1-alpha-D-glucosylmutase [Aureimonas phyllosphaerae]SFF59226.1 maltooligosyl trehalose synthase [Aureimonas phyllosphaerae]
MSRPLVATYRLQFREGTGFGEARDLIPYLQTLGVSHLYASPIFAASPGSTHGYDVVDYNHFEEDLGGDNGFNTLSDALSAADLGLILDFVPNHMGVSPANAWWEDVLRWGQDSHFAQTFDISWEAEKILVPTLGKPYGEALKDGDLSVVYNEDRRELRFSAGGYELPLDPRTLSHVFAFVDHPERDRMVRRFSAAVPADGEELNERFAEHVADPAFLAALKAGVAAINADKDALHALHEAQAWRLAWWRLAREKLSYRRFFEIADLIGVRQEMRRVFRESHRTILRLARERRLDGIRIDHVDGVADPKNYLADLHRAFETIGRDVKIHVEKILTGPERLRRDWNIAGTTGYEFITALSGLFVDASREEAMTKAYADFIGTEEDLRQMIVEQKRLIFSHNLAGELAFLTDTALSVAARDLDTRDFGRDAMMRSIVEVAAALPVYRTYASVDGVPEPDIQVIDDAVALAQSRREVEANRPVAFVGRLLKLDFEDGQDVTGALTFARRFQQTTGAVMAKAVEDTTFYRYNRLIALNEVGGEPDHYGADVPAFHREMAIRLEDQPEGLMASSTHDTKRGEDARARQYTISEAPERWAEIAAKAAETLAPWRKDIGETGVSPDPATEWGFYQALVGVIPADFDPADGAMRKELSDRLAAFAEKAAREAKRFTTWTAPDEAYEGALKGFVEAALSKSGSGDFLEAFWRDVQPFVVAGALTSLSQTLVKLTAPGVPDIYQGTEFYDLSLVDPDNRRKIDFKAREAAMTDGHGVAEALPHWRDGRVKAKLTAAALKARIKAPELFTTGKYMPLEVTGEKRDHVLAFARSDREGRFAVTVVPRLALGLLGDRAEMPMPDPAAWGDTAVRLPSQLSGARFEDILNLKPVSGAASLPLSRLLADLPVALLIAD